MARTTGTVAGIHPFMHISNALVWISAVIVMGILSFFISQNNNQSTHVIYEEVIAVLTVAFFFVAWLLGSWADYSLMFNLVFSYLWLVAVVFTASDWSNNGSALDQTVEAFSFIAFFCLFFNTVFHWHTGFGVGRRRGLTAAV